MNRESRRIKRAAYKGFIVLNDLYADNTTLDTIDSVKKVIIYTDGGCSPNPGPGGYGVVLLYREHRQELSGGYRITTNNRMELTAAIQGLQALKEPCEVTLFSDSQCVVNGIMKGWARRW